MSYVQDIYETMLKDVKWGPIFTYVVICQEQENQAIFCAYLCFFIIGHFLVVNKNDFFSILVRLLTVKLPVLLKQCCEELWT